MAGPGPVCAFGPEVHDADFRFCRDAGRFDDGCVIYFALEDPVMGIGDGGNIFFFNINDYTLSRKGKKRFEHIIFQIGRNLFYFIQEKCFWNVGMADERQCVF